MFSVQNRVFNNRADEPYRIAQFYKTRHLIKLFGKCERAQSIVRRKPREKR